MKHLVKLFFVSVLLLVGCNESKNVQHAQFDSSKLAYTKPHAPIDMAYTSAVTPVAGATIRYDLVFTSGIDADDLQVTVTADDGLALMEYPQQRSLGVQQTQQQNPIAVSVQPQHDGVFYLNVSATLVMDGQQQSRSFAIPVDVGAVDLIKHLKTNGVVEKTSDGERIISMPAQQTLKESLINSGSRG